MKLEGQVALITGSGQGIGKATALTMAGEGAGIVLNDIVDERLKRAESDVKAAGVKVLAVNADVTRREQVERMVDQAVDTFGKIDILVNNVGGGRNAGGVEMSDEEFKSIFDLNLKSHYLCCYAVVPHMRKRKSGKIVNISASQGKYKADMVDLAFGAAKAGVLAMTRFLASELGPDGINVNCVIPGLVSTEEGEKYWNSLPQLKRDDIMDVLPLGRLGEPQEIANAIVSLVSPESSYITGASLDVNGGWWMQT